MAEEVSQSTTTNHEENGGENSFAFQFLYLFNINRTKYRIKNDGYNK